MDYLIAFMLGLAGLIVVINKKRVDAESDNILTKTKEKDLQLERDNVILDSSIQTKKEGLEELSKEEQNAKEANSNIIDFWNKRKR